MNPAINENKAILIVDDDAGQRSLLETVLASQGFRVHCAASGQEALDWLKSQAVAMVISDVRMPGLSGLELLRIIRTDAPLLPVLLVTAYADVRDAVGAVRDGAVDYLEKPIDLDGLLTAVRHSLHISDGPPATYEEHPLPSGVVAESPSMQSVLRKAAIVAASDARVLITGESGTGKEVVAEVIHRWSPRRERPMVRVNCAAIPEAMLESELFGHEKGAFTGATGQRVGRFEEADGGTILLDEIGEMTAALQAKLLRVTQDGSFHRLGANQEHKTSARIVAATNRDLEADVAARRFREDLFYRLNVIELNLRPLRERQDDILPLAQHFAREQSQGQPRFSSAATEVLQQYHWPGNVRELRNAMEYATLMARGGVILPEHLPARVRGANGPKESNSTPSFGSSQTMEDIEREAIFKALEENDNNRTRAAKALGISRRTLTYRIRRLRDQGYDL